MWNGSRKRFSLISVINKLDDFLNNSSVHGLRYLSSNEFFLFRCLWLILVIVVCGLASFIIYHVWGRFTDQPLRLDLCSQHSPVGPYTFPAVTVCNTEIKRPILEKYLNSLNDSKLSEFNNLQKIFLRTKKAFEDLEVVKSVDETLVNFGKILESNEVTIRDVLRNVKIPCNEYILQCRWKSENVSCESLFTIRYTGYGYCCVFNLKFKKTESNQVNNSYVGPFMGLSLVVKVPLKGDLRVFVHQPYELPWKALGGSNYYTLIQPNHIAYIDVDVEYNFITENVKNLNIASRKCILSDDFSLKYFPVYFMGLCMLECTMNASLNLCGCALFNTPISEKKSCLISHIACMITHYDIITSPLLVRPDSGYDVNFDSYNKEEINLVKKCPCWRLCDFNAYKIRSQILPLDAVEFSKDEFYTFINEDERTAIVHVYQSKQVMKNWCTTLVTGIIDLLCNLGGSFGLCIGASLLSFVEILYYCFIQLILPKIKQSITNHKNTMSKILNENDPVNGNKHSFDKHIGKKIITINGPKMVNFERHEN